jgi:citrate lyase subunit beta/citryl-CoA lyase
VSDIAELAGLPGLRGVVVPKAEAPHVAEAVRHWPGREVGIVALIETARGLHRAYEIASCEAGADVGQSNGQMIDQPDIDRAHQILARAKARPESADPGKRSQRRCSRWKASRSSRWSKR